MTAIFGRKCGIFRNQLLDLDCQRKTIFDIHLPTDEREAETMRKAVLAMEGLKRRATPRIETKMKLREERIQERSSGVYRLKRKRPIVLPALTARAARCQGRPEMYTPEEVEYKRVEETLKIFDAYYRHFVQEEERRCRGNTNDAVNFKKRIKRPDLKAISIMKQSNAILYPKGIGSLKGIDVGHRFFSRAEMVVVGLHDHWMNGIDFMGASYGKFFEYRHYRFPIAVSVVISGQYEDDLDNLEEVIYTGVGGNNFMRSDHQNLVQKLTGGNLALKNSMEQQIPVRVTRGHVSKSNLSYVGKLYTYDGLYRVVEYWNEKGVSGSNVWKYRLQRLQGQPPLTTNQVHFARGTVSQRSQITNRQLISRLKHRLRSLNSSIEPTIQFSRIAIEHSSPDSTQNPTLTKPIVPIELSGSSSSQKILKVVPTLMRLPGTVIEDISEGQENFPIPVTNLIDDPPVLPTGYKYCNSLRINRLDKELSGVGSGCNCEGNCNDPTKCICARLNGLDFHRHGGRLTKAKDIIFECSPSCGCGPSCINRTSQRGLRYRLEVFRTSKKRWALRSWDPIPAGNLVCECTGVLKRTGGMDTLGRCDFVIGIDWLKAQKGSDGRCLQVPKFCVDARKVGNVARFINHSCQPNIFLQLVLGSDHSTKPARILVFGADDIAPLQELTYDSCFAVGSVVGHDGQIKRQPCCCGAPNCRRG
ncbi:histone-lysine N-methyltransferase, H3 lysine-9 specific SUVH4-like [Aristolochia californica]|uniref:histone-lysine N-methyltransferase, H3 lysine-9 specific SUVH4-like n=1 Tax=Aristolochia californica TaxID=171875 RepID=UPI0035D632F7